MKKIIFLFVFIISLSSFSQKVEMNTQNVLLANSYFRKGEYEKAIALYKPLHEQNLIRRDYFKNLLISYQQLENYELAHELIQKQIELFPNQMYLNVEVGYNFQLQNQLDKAKIYYDKSLNYIKKNPNYGFVIGHTFKQNHLLDYALQSYQIAKKLNPKLNTEISEAQIYGEKGELDKMFSSYLNLIDKNEKYYPTIQRYIATFITDDKNNKTNILFKNLLLKRAQNNPKDSWNILLSWLFMQQKDYNKAFIQERSLFNRNHKNLDRIYEIGIISFENNELETSKTIFDFVLNKNLDNNSNQKIVLQSKIYLVQIDNKLANSNTAFKKVDASYQSLLKQYGKNTQSIDLHLAYADFLAFNFDQSEKAILILNDILPLALSKFQKGLIQIKLADILVYTSQFNQALILYTQVQTELKNSILAQESRFKVAQTSYFKGDFQWAQIQLKVLKASTSQLIANDALDLNLLITNNIVNDSIQDALKIYAKAELLAYQNKNLQAIDTLNKVLLNFKGHAIEDDALFKQAKLFIDTKKYIDAEHNYLKIIQNYPESILIDDCYFALAELYNYLLNDSEKAKEMYQKIIFEYPSSIYLIDARKAYRKLRGDDMQ
ncbi:MAG: tetratricopeptide repeat protein [Flavobacteriaceae bacterium]|nr:tetratricopeptide repeat protein [Flavobacteriaceae bacterium]